jgi:hypothetical protein
MASRKYAFEIGQAVNLRNGIAGKVVARAPDADYPKVVQVTPQNISQFEGEKLDALVITVVEVNAYQVEFEGDNGRPDTAWWQEDMLSAA